MLVHRPQLIKSCISALQEKLSDPKIRITLTLLDRMFIYFVQEYASLLTTKIDASIFITFVYEIGRKHAPPMDSEQLLYEGINQDVKEFLSFLFSNTSILTPFVYSLSLLTTRTCFSCNQKFYNDPSTDEKLPFLDLDPVLGNYKSSFQEMADKMLNIPRSKEHTCETCKKIGNLNGGSAETRLYGEPPEFMQVAVRTRDYATKKIIPFSVNLEPLKFVTSNNIAVEYIPIQWSVHTGSHWYTYVYKQNEWWNLCDQKAQSTMIAAFQVEKNAPSLVLFMRNNKAYVSPHTVGSNPGIPPAVVSSSAIPVKATTPALRTPATAVSGKAPAVAPAVVFSPAIPVKATSPALRTPEPAISSGKAPAATPAVVSSSAIPVKTTTPALRTPPPAISGKALAVAPTPVVLSEPSVEDDSDSSPIMTDDQVSKPTENAVGRNSDDTPADVVDNIEDSLVNALKKPAKLHQSRIQSFFTKEVVPPKVGRPISKKKKARGKKNASTVQVVLTKQSLIQKDSTVPKKVCIYVFNHDLTSFVILKHIYMY